jgi:lipocalin
MVDNGTAVNLLGVVMVDGTAPADEFAPAVAKLDSLGIPTYQIASPPRAENAWGSTTEQLALLHPDQFVGVQLDVSAASDAVVTLATGWINDMYDGSYAPTNPYYGIYGSPNDGTYVSNQRIMMGGTAATTLPAPPPVDIAQYAGTWYEQGSVKQPPTSGRVNTQVTYTPEPDGSVTVAWAGNEGSPTGPAWSVTGVAIPVNAPFNTRLNVSFSGQPDTNEPGTSWILDYAPDYSWAIIGDPTGTSGTILTRDRVISPTDYTALVDQAYRLGVRGVITPTLQSP